LREHARTCCYLSLRPVREREIKGKRGRERKREGRDKEREKEGGREIR
jgi:hypothetical protein